MYSTNNIYGYRGIHNWVQRKLGTPKLCEICGDSSRRRYEWANISGKYKKSLEDWRRLCVPCHGREKHIGYCANGHELVGHNSYQRIKKAKNGNRYTANGCRQCDYLYIKKYRIKKQIS